MSGKKYHTVLIMPSTPGKRIKKISLPSFYWRIFYVLLAVVFSWAGVGTWSVHNSKRLARDSLRLEEENQHVKTLLEEEKKKVEYLDKQLKKIQHQAQFIKRFLGFESSGESEGNIGQGGLEISPNSNLEQSNLTSGLDSGQLTLTNISAVPNLTEENISELDEDLNRIIVTLKGRQEKLAHTPSVSPVAPSKSWISSSFGKRISPFTHKKQVHLGIDIAGWKGTPILAPANGKVISVKKWGSMGLMIKIRHDETYTTAYGHLLKAIVKKGQKVKRGQVIGQMGNSGRSTGYHLHYELTKKGKRINPFPYMMDWNKNTLAAMKE